jgi:hypothetical protein
MVGFNLVTGGSEGVNKLVYSCCTRHICITPEVAPILLLYFYIYIIWIIKLLYCVFQIDSLFCLGSPLSVFLALRMRHPQAPGHVETILPPFLCNRFYNVFHPSDPVAYRYELCYIKTTFTLGQTEISLWDVTLHMST